MERRFPSVDLGRNYVNFAMGPFREPGVCLARTCTESRVQIGTPAPRDPTTMQPTRLSHSMTNASRFAGTTTPPNMHNVDSLAYRRLHELDPEYRRRQYRLVEPCQHSGLAQG